MAPTDLTAVQQQTEEILECLLNDHDVGVQSRMFMDVETDGPDDDFNAIEIAEKLRTVADALNDDVTFKAALNDLKKAAVQEATEAAFSNGVEALCKNQALKSPEVTSEIQLIKASAALGCYVIKSSPDLKNKVHAAMRAFLHRRVDNWVSQQGGWAKVKI